MGNRHPAADGVMALVHQGNTQARNGRDTAANTRDLAAALRDSGIPDGAAVADLIDPGNSR
ncbi:MAG TPA: hypothetical protein VFQ42_04175 [Mycobacterium sp.]|nr:hypothetical protein [Mycobacterium sp.]